MGEISEHITDSFLNAFASDDVTHALSWFFTPEPLFMAGGTDRFSQFGAGHLLMVATCLVVALLLARRYQHLPWGLENGSPRRRQLLWMACIALGLLAIRDAFMATRGLMEPVFWPLHICNFCEYLMLAYALYPHGKVGLRLGDLLFCWAFPGSIGALLFPGWRYCPLLSFASLGGFAEHTLLLAFALCMLSGNGYRPNWRRFWLPAIIAAAGGIAFRIINPMWNTNFFFVTNPESSGPPFVWAESIFGDPGYLVFYLMAAIAIWLAAYEIWNLFDRHRST
ncbi:MAG: YwaF family protein [Eggerthellaceae bacterium]|nr:YwaF family protein [Eggerthellaceae bacterium]